MKIAIVSYSFTGNNEVLATNVAKALDADHIRITEKKKRSTKTITFDLLLNRTPRVSPKPQVLKKYDKVIFVAPVWMGQPAFTLRAYLKELKEDPRDYGFVTISGGSLNPNPKLKSNITKLAGYEPTVFADQYVADIMSKDEEINPKTVQAYRLSSTEHEKLVKRAVSAIREKM